MDNLTADEREEWRDGVAEILATIEGWDEAAGRRPGTTDGHECFSC